MSAIASKLAFAIAPLASAALLAAACGDDPPRLDFTVPDATADARPPSASDEDASSPSDAGVDPDVRGAFDPDDEPVSCTNTPCFTQLVGGSDHFCARSNDGTVRCWGDDTFGALGRGDGDAGDPMGVVGLAAVTQISAAGSTTCARVDDGGVQCWGDNRNGVLGLAAGRPIADQDRHPLATPVALDAPATRVDVGPVTACAVLTSGKLSCWGRDDQSQLAGSGGAGSIRGPMLVDLGSLSLTATMAGSFTVFGRDAAGDVWSWGGLAGEEGIISGRVASLSPDPTPRRIDALSKVTSFAATASIVPPWNPVWEPGDPLPEPPKPHAHACAIADGEVHCWGRSFTGALCTGVPDSEQRPRRAPFAGKTWPQQIATGDEITCARMTDGSIHCCGDDAYGRLGRGSVGGLAQSFTPASAFKGHAVHVAMSNRAVCALLQGGSIECWGSNEKGELGKAPDSAPHPIPVPLSLSLGFRHDALTENASRCFALRCGWPGGARLHYRSDQLRAGTASAHRSGRSDAGCSAGVRIPLLARLEEGALGLRRRGGQGRGRVRCRAGLRSRPLCRRVSER